MAPCPGCLSPLSQLHQLQQSSDNSSNSNSINSNSNSTACQVSLHASFSLCSDLTWCWDKTKDNILTSLIASNNITQLSFGHQPRTENSLERNLWVWQVLSLVTWYLWEKISLHAESGLSAAPNIWSKPEKIFHLMELQYLFIKCQSSSEDYPAATLLSHHPIIGFYQNILHRVWPPSVNPEIICKTVWLLQSCQSYQPTNLLALF